jgi:hypothetical protein
MRMLLRTPHLIFARVFAATPATSCLTGEVASETPDSSEQARAGVLFSMVNDEDKYLDRFCDNDSIAHLE